MSKTNIRSFITFPRLAALAGLGLLVFFAVVGPIGAQTVTQGYNSSEPLQRGMLVVIDEKDTSQVAPVTTETAGSLHGVVVNANDAPVTLSEEGQQVFVASAGQFDVLVTDENGPIKVGEYITASSVKGIGMKADSRQALVVGKALAAFDGKNGTISSSKDSASGRTVHIGRIAVDISVARNPQFGSAGSAVPEALRKAADTIADKSVTDTRVYISFAVLIISTVIAGSLLYAGVKNGMVSIGRNPLSKHSIMRGLLQVVLTSLIIFISGIFAVYLLLKL